MLVGNVGIGEVVVANGWDIAFSNKPSSQPYGFLIPHGMNHKRAVEMGHSITLLYLGPTRIVMGDPSEEPELRKMHNFLTESGRVIALEGHEFRHLSSCKTE